MGDIAWESGRGNVLETVLNLRPEPEREREKAGTQTHPGAAAEQESGTESSKWAEPEEAGMEGVGG